MNAAVAGRMEDVAVNHFNFSPLWLIGTRRIRRMRRSSAAADDSAFFKLGLASGGLRKKKREENTGVYT